MIVASRLLVTCLGVIICLQRQLAKLLNEAELCTIANDLILALYLIISLWDGKKGR